MPSVIEILDTPQRATQPVIEIPDSLSMIKIGDTPPL
jgi:hypothetical protein